MIADDIPLGAGGIPENAGLVADHCQAEGIGWADGRDGVRRKGDIIQINGSTALAGEREGEQGKTAGPGVVRDLAGQAKPFDGDGDLGPIGGGDAARELCQRHLVLLAELILQADVEPKGGAGGLHPKHDLGFCALVAVVEINPASFVGVVGHDAHDLAADIGVGEIGVLIRNADRSSIVFPVAKTQAEFVRAVLEPGAGYVLWRAKADGVHARADGRVLHEPAPGGADFVVLQHQDVGAIVNAGIDGVEAIADGGIPGGHIRLALVEAIQEAVAVAPHRAFPFGGVPPLDVVLVHEVFHGRHGFRPRIDHAGRKGERGDGPAVRGVVFVVVFSEPERPGRHLAVVTPQVVGVPGTAGGGPAPAVGPEHVILHGIGVVHFDGAFALIENALLGDDGMVLAAEIPAGAEINPAVGILPEVQLQGARPWGGAVVAPDVVRLDAFLVLRCFGGFNDAEQILAVAKVVVAVGPRGPGGFAIQPRAQLARLRALEILADENTAGDEERVIQEGESIVHMEAGAGRMSFITIQPVGMPGPSVDPFAHQGVGGGHAGKQPERLKHLLIGVGVGNPAAVMAEADGGQFKADAGHAGVGCPGVGLGGVVVGDVNQQVVRPALLLLEKTQIGLLDGLQELPVVGIPCRGGPAEGQPADHRPP